MSLKSSILLSLAATFCAALPAVAADYDPPLVEEVAAEYVPVEVGSGWYLRGDIGYVISTRTTGNFDYRTFNAALGTYGQASFATQRLRSNLTWGGGFGYRFTDWLRADFTVDGFKTRFNGTTTSAAPCVGTAAFVGTTCRSDDGATMSTLSFMGNVYGDLGTYAGFTPYAGAGAGYSYVTWTNLSNSLYCVGATCPAGFVGTVTHGGTKSWRFSYNLMAGMAYDVTKNMKIDLGYKYRRIAGGPMFNFDAASIAAGARGVQGNDRGLSTHEIRVGLRYELW
jgi:opacity protein-like surface antigen